MVCAITFLISNIMDDKLTEKIQAYLKMLPGERNVVEGATMLLSLNRNRIFFQNVLRKPEKYAEKVAYELHKFLTIRLDRQTVADVVRMNEEVLPLVNQTLSEGRPVISADDDKPQDGTVVRGKRKDHDDLPDKIKALWDECATIWFRIKELFEQLKGMNNSPACDRYEYLKQLDDADKRYRANMQAYDSFVIGVSANDDEKKKVEGDPATIAKKVGAARKYLSDNKKKLADLKNSNEEKYLMLLAKVQERYDYLISTGNVVEADQVKELAVLGLKMI